MQYKVPCLAHYCDEWSLVGMNDTSIEGTLVVNCGLDAKSARQVAGEGNFFLIFL